MTASGLLGVEFLAVEDEVASEIFFADRRVFGQFFGSALEEDLAFEQQVGSVGDAQRLLGVMVGDQDADVLFFKMIDNRLDVLDGDRVDSGKGFVEHDELRVDGQAAGYFGAAAFAA